jgi:hypothetical protein
VLRVPVEETERVELVPLQIVEPLELEILGIGGLLTVTATVAVAVAPEHLPLTVSVNVITPLSLGPGVYVVFKAFAFAKVPLPPDHTVDV